MPIQREELAKQISDKLHLLAAQLKTRSRASLTDANHSLEYVMERFFNALFGWNLVNLNTEQPNYPAADLGDRQRRIAVQVTNEETSQKIRETREKSINHKLEAEFDRLIIFFLLPKRPATPKKLLQPTDLPQIECWDLADLLKQMLGMEIAALTKGLQVLEEELPTAASRNPAPTLHRLPPRPSGFVGREADLLQLRTLNPESGAMLTGLRGMGGIGKTALALVLAHEWAPRFPDAQLFLDGRGTHAHPPSAGDLLAQVIQTFHPTAKLPDDESQLKSIYHDLLGKQRVLILLDNARDAAQVTPLIPPTGCALIVTSRHSFMLGKTAPYNVGKLPDAEAALLLREFYPVLGDVDAAALVKLCAGLPLALRLAGAHLALDAVERGGKANVAAYLRDLSSGRLATLDADAPDAGEVTISETLRLSEAQLSEDERTAWRQLGVFTASFDTRAAAAIVAFFSEKGRPFSEKKATEIETMLNHFVRRSLLNREGEERFQLHDLAGEYALSQLDEEALAELHLAHAQHYTDVGDEAEAQYITGDSVGGLDLFDREREQMEAAYVWLADREDEAAARQLIKLVDAVAHTCDLRFQVSQRIVWLESQLRAARTLQDRHAEGNSLGNLGNMLCRLGDARLAIVYYEQALEIACQIDDRRGEGNSYGGLGTAYAHLGNLSDSIEHHQQCLLIQVEIRDRRGEGRTLGNLGNAYLRLGDADRAMEYYQKRLAVARETEDRHGEVFALGHLGNAHLARHSPHLANEYYDKQFVIAREIGDRHGEGASMWNSAGAYELLRNRAEAITRASSALAIFEAIESPHAEKVRAQVAEWRSGSDSDPDAD